MNEKYPFVLNRIRLAACDVRVTTGGLHPLLGLATCAKAESFAQAILEHYHGRSAAWVALGMVFHRAAPRLIVQRTTHRHRLSLAPRLALTMLDGHHETGRPNSGVGGEELALSHPGPEQRTRAPLVALGSAPVSASGGVSPDEIVHYLRKQGRMVFVPNPPVVRRIVNRLERRPSIASGPGLASPQHVSAVPAARPVSRAVHRPQPLAPEADSPPPAAPTWRHSLRQAETDQPQPLDLDQFQLNRLADQVVQVIDGRIIARRERLGRI